MILIIVVTWLITLRGGGAEELKSTMYIRNFNSVAKRKKILEKYLRGFIPSPPPPPPSTSYACAPNLFVLFK
jgi:hypothetical protein